MVIFSENFHIRQLDTRRIATMVDDNACSQLVDCVGRYLSPDCQMSKDGSDRTAATIRSAVA